MVLGLWNVGLVSVAALMFHAFCLLRSCFMHFVCCAHLQDKLGRAAVTLTRVVMNGSHEEEYQLMDVAKGWIKMRLVWKQL